MNNIYIIMKRGLIICIFLLSTIVLSSYAQKVDKFSHEITIDCEDVAAAKMTSNETIYGHAKNIDITFPFKTHINPNKGAEIILNADGYNEYKLIIPPGGFESHYMVSFTASVKKTKKTNSNKNSLKGQTMDITIDCTQFESAKMTRPTGIGTMLLFGALGAMIDQQKKSRDITFPYTTTIEIDKQNKFLFSVPGYNIYELVIPEGNSETNFTIHFTENAKEMAKIRKRNAAAEEKAASNKVVYAHEERVVAETPVKREAPVSRDTPGKSSLEQTIIRWMVDSDPQGARIFYRIISSIPEQVKNTNESYLLTTPYEETRSFNILGLTYENAHNVQMEIKLMKPGYHTQIKRFNLRQAIDQQEISAFFTLVKKEEENNE